MSDVVKIGRRYVGGGGGYGFGVQWNWEMVYWGAEMSFGRWDLEASMVSIDGFWKALYSSSDADLFDT